jgi:hypothetical protein
MARSTSVANDQSVPPDDEAFDYPEPDGFDVRDEQIEHLKRILDLQIEGSRNIYDDALRLMLINVVAIGGLLAAAMVAVGVGGFGVIGPSEQISMVLLAFGMAGLFVSMAYATKAYLADIADYATIVSSESREEFKAKYLSRNLEIVRENAQVMEAEIEAVRNSILGLVLGLSGLVLGFAFQVVPLDTWAQMAISLAGLLVVGYLVNNVIGVGYLQAGKERFVR